MDIDIDKQKMVDIAINHPYVLGHKLGFKDLNKINNEWIREFIRGKSDYTLQAHRGSYKTTCISIALALLILLKPDKKIFFLRKTDTDVKEIVNQIYKILQSKLWHDLSKIFYKFPIAITTANAFEINTNLNFSPKGTSQLVAQGIGGSLTGKHFDYIFTDDIININDRISRPERERTKLIYQELQNVKNRDGKIVNTGTPWHKEDCFTIMPNIHRFDCYETGLMTSEQIAVVKSNMTPSLFSSNYELRHIADSQALFKNPQVIKDDSELVRDGICHIDASYGGEDYTAFTIGKRGADGNLYVFGKLWHKHVDNCIPEILELKKQYMVGKTYCEDNGDKGYLKKRLKEFGDIVSSYHEDTNKYIKISTFVYKDWPNIRFLDSTDKEYIEQVESFDENAEHDDAPDSLACICRKLKKSTESEYQSVFCV